MCFGGHFDILKLKIKTNSVNIVNIALIDRDMGNNLFVVAISNVLCLVFTEADFFHIFPTCFIYKVIVARFTTWRSLT